MTTNGTRAMLAREIKDTIARIIEMDPADIRDDAHFIDDLGIDSLLALEMLAEFERKYRIEIPEETLPEFTSVEKVIDVVLAQLSPATIEGLVAAAE